MTCRTIRIIRKTGKSPPVYQLYRRLSPIDSRTLCAEVSGMRWSSLAIAAALGPAAAGCNIAHNAARNIINEPHVVWTQHAIKHDLRQAAKAAWETSRDKCPEHADSAEFRDGFIDGYVDYLDRGGNGSIRAVPVAKYTRHKKYFTEDGQCVAKEYLLGFKLGQDIAISSGQRRLLTVPVLLPQEPTGPIPFNVQPAASEAPPPMIPPQPPESVARSTRHESGPESNDHTCSVVRYASGADGPPAAPSTDRQDRPA